MRVPTTPLSLMSLKFSVVHKLVGENWLILVHLFGGRQVCLVLTHWSFSSSVTLCAAQAVFGLLSLSIWCRRGLLPRDGPSHPPLNILESRVPQLQAAMIAPAIWWPCLALGDRTCLHLDHSLRPSPWRMPIRKLCRLSHLERWLIHGCFTIWGAQTREQVCQWEKTIYPLSAVEPGQMPAQPSMEKEECIFMPPSIFFHVVYIYITQDHP